MSGKKRSYQIFNQEQRRMVWTMIILLVLASTFLFIFSWRLSRLQSLPNLTNSSILTPLFQGSVLSEQSISLLSNYENLDEPSFFSSPDARSFAYILKNQDTQQLILNEQAGPLFSSISFMAFSPDSSSFAYTAKKGDKEVAVINGSVGREYDWIFNPRMFSPDSRYFIYKARRGDKEFLVINDKESRAYDHIDNLVINPEKTSLFFDSRYIIYKARRADKEFLVINNQESRAYDRIYSLMLNPEKTSLFFFARDGERLWRGEVPLITE